MGGGSWREMLLIFIMLIGVGFWLVKNFGEENRRGKDILELGSKIRVE